MNKLNLIHLRPVTHSFFVVAIALAAGCGATKDSDYANQPARVGPASVAEMRMEDQGGSKPLPAEHVADAGPPKQQGTTLPELEQRPDLPSSSPVTAGNNPRSPAGINWMFIQVKDFDGELPGDRPFPQMILSRGNGRMGGSDGCNTMTAAFDLDINAGTLKFSRLENANGMCTGDMADKEDAIMNALNVTDSFRIEGNDLLLYSKGNQVARLTNPAAQQ